MFGFFMVVAFVMGCLVGFGTKKDSDVKDIRQLKEYIRRLELSCSQTIHK